MRAPQSLDELIAKTAAEFADQLRAVAAMADKEEEIRIATERQLAFIEREAGIELEGRHEFTVAKGRIDSVYSRVIIEYKNPSSPAARIGPRADSPGSKKVVEQIKQRFRDLRDEHGHKIQTLFGVGFDGKHFIFVRFRDDKWDVQDPVEVNRHSAERFLWALFNLGHKGKPFTPEYLAGDFGAQEGSLATAGVHALYDAIVATNNPKAQTFFSQWKILFGEVCGYAVDNPSDKIKKLAVAYGVSAADLRPAELLFALHTYYALFMKLLAAEIVAFFHRLPTPLERMIQSGTSAKLKREMEELEAGGIFRHLNITNFLEGDLFAWYLPVWCEPIEELIRAMVTRLDDYNPGTLSEDPAVSRDLLKKLYHELFPRTVRHDLGEYYTPDWLAEHVLKKVGYIGDPEERVLDPACGSGTFLVMAIGRIKAWFEENRERCSLDEGDLCRLILANVIGFDLNPLAVMAARTNFLIAIRDLITHAGNIEIPVYLCDSVMTPSEHRDLFSGGRKLTTAAGTFIIPFEVANDRAAVSGYAEQLESCVRAGYSATEFLDRCRDEGLPVNAARLHTDLYNELVRLDKENRNGVWARIIKNSFAPLFVGRFDFIVGNPPWVLWDNLPNEFRESLRTLMTERYGLMARSQSTFTRLGQAKKDLSMVFFYCSLDRYCKDDGRLGFVITQTLFQTTAGDEFRRFSLPDGKKINVFAVEDWVAVEPFRPKAGNKTATVFAEIGKATSYPVPYDVWSPNEDFDRESASTTVIASCCTVTSQWAHPSDPKRSESFWALSSNRSRSTRSAGVCIEIPKARAGINTSLESAYKIEILKTVSSRLVLIRNITKGAKKPVPIREAQIESELVVPFVSGESVGRWRTAIAGYYIVPHSAETAMQPIDERLMKTRFPKTYAYFHEIKSQLETRSLHLRWGGGHPFYSLYNIGPYTFAPFKVCWQRTTKKFGTAVLSTLASADLNGEDRMAFPNGDIMFIPFTDEETAHYVCAVLNSSGARTSIDVCITTKAHKDIINVVDIPDPQVAGKNFQRLSRLSMECHRLLREGRAEQLQATENQINEIVAKILKES
jgi:SAM-dependent methyltransferase